MSCLVHAAWQDMQPGTSRWCLLTRPRVAQPLCSYTEKLRASGVPIWICLPAAGAAGVGQARWAALPAHADLSACAALPAPAPAGEKEGWLWPLCQSDRRAEASLFHASLHCVALACRQRGWWAHSPSCCQRSS